MVDPSTPFAVLWLRNDLFDMLTKSLTDDENQEENPDYHFDKVRRCALKSTEILIREIYLN